MKKVLIIALAAMAGCWSVGAQSRGGLKINEVMVENLTSMEDDFGQTSAWIELFNSTHAAMEIRSVFLTTDPLHTPLENMKSSDPERYNSVYPVPLGDVNTRIPKRQHAIFWADGEPTRGTFHARFTLKPGQPNWIGVYDANGLTLIDSVTVPPMPADHSYARIIDGKDGVDGNPTWEIRDGQGDKYITPSSNNKIREVNNKIETFKERDPHGFALSIMAMCIVFSALLLLCLCFLTINKIGARVTRRNKMKAQGLEVKETPRDERPDHDSGEEIAAIVMALHEHLDAHDTENAILTIHKVKKSYSPWNSNIYSMRELPHR